MTIYDEGLITLLNDGKVIISQANGYSIRTINSAGGRGCVDSLRRNYGVAYWKKEALHFLGARAEDIVMEAKKGKVAFFRD